MPRVHAAADPVLPRNNQNTVKHPLYPNPINNIYKDLDSMAKTWQTSYIKDVNEGTTANDGTGDSIRDAFTKVDDNFTVLNAFLNGAAVTAGDYAEGPKFTSLEVATLTSNVTTLGNITVGNINSQSTFNANINAGGNIVPIVGGVYNLGSASHPFANLYVLQTVSVSQVQTSTDAGLLTVHANASPGDIKDVGIFANISHSYSSNTYAFFGYQKTTNDFVYKITNTDATKGNSVVYNGIYGNVHVGSMFLSNTTATTSNVTGALIVAGGISSNNEIQARGNVWSAGYKVLTTGDVSLLGYPTYTGSGSLFLGTTLFAAAVPSTSSGTGAVVIQNGGLGVFGNINAGGYLGNFYGIIANPTQPYITSLGSLTGLTVVGSTSTTTLQATSIGATNILATSTISPTLVSTSITSSTVQAATIGNTGAVLTGTLSTAAQPNITSIGTLTGLTVTGNTASTSTLYARGVYDFSSRVVSATNGSPGAGNITINSNGTAYLTQTGPGAVTVGSAAAVPVLTFDTYGRISSVTTAAVSSTLGLSGTSGTGTVSLLSQSLTFAGAFGVTATASGQTITVGTSQDLRTTAGPTFAGITSAGTISPSANVTYNLGSTTAWWSTIYGKATQAKYADLAEKYVSDRNYEPGTVVIFGGTKEITVTNEFADERVAGAVSTDPAYLMNALEDGLPIALRGKIPLRVVGPVVKGDSLVTSIKPGCAISVGRDRSYGQAVFAKALESNGTESEKVIIAVIL